MYDTSGFEAFMRHRADDLKADFEVVEDTSKRELRIINKRNGAIVSCHSDCLWQDFDSPMLTALASRLADANIRANEQIAKKQAELTHRGLLITKTEKPFDAVQAMKELQARLAEAKAQAGWEADKVLRAGHAKQQSKHYRELANKELAEELAATLEENARLRVAIEALLSELDAERRRPLERRLTTLPSKTSAATWAKNQALAAEQLVT